MVALTVDQQALVAAEVGRWISAQGIVTTADWDNAIAKSVVDARQQFIIKGLNETAVNDGTVQTFIGELPRRFEGRIYR